MMVKIKVPMRRVRIIRVLVALSRELSRMLISCTHEWPTQGVTYSTLLQLHSRPRTIAFFKPNSSKSHSCATK